MKKLLFLLLPAIGFAQANYPGVCIQCENPSEKLDVNGKIKSRDIPLVTTAEYVIVTNADGVHRKVLLSSLTQNAGTCPNFIRNQSSGYHIKFSSPSSIPNPNSDLIIQGKNFNAAGAHINNNTYFYSWSNTTGQPINIDNMTINFSGLTCTYTN